MGGTPDVELHLQRLIVQLRVLGLVHQYIPVRCAGAETHIHSMLRTLAGRGHRVDVVLSAQSGDPYVVDGVNVWPTVDAKHDVYNWLPEAEILVAHLDNTTRANVLGYLNEIPVAVVHHNTFRVAREALLLHGARTDLVSVNSEYMRDDLVSTFDDLREKLPPVVVTRPVVKVDEYQTTPGDRVTLINMRKRDPKDRDRITKGGEIFRSLAETMPSVDFLGVTGIYGDQMDMSGLSNVEVVPHVPHHEMRDQVYGRTRILLVPSSYESWGRVASEAMASGIPVVASPTPGLVEQLGDAGTFVDPEDPDAWREAVFELLNEPRRWAAMSAVSLKRALELEQLGQADLLRWAEAVESTVVHAPRKVLI